MAPESETDSGAFLLPIQRFSSKLCNSWESMPNRHDFNDKYLGKIRGILR